MVVSPHFLRDSTDMVRDELSEVFDLVEVRNVMSGGMAVRGRWSSRFEIDAPLKLMALVSGRVRLTVDGAETVDMGPGDVAIMNGRRWAQAEGGSGEGPVKVLELTQSDVFLRIDGADCDDPGAAVIIGSHIEVNGVGRELLMQALPPLGHVRGSEASALRGLLVRLVDEVTGNRIGASFAIHQHAQLLLLDVLRAYITQTDDLPAGWLRLFADERLRPAVRMLHADPGKPWRLEELASGAAMSRTAFAERFRAVAGVPPLTYLNAWRMLIAQRRLRDGDTRVGSLAFELGYGSESSFSNAFKREVGMSPLRYRASVRDEFSPSGRSKLA